MGIFDNYFEPQYQGSRGLPGWLETLQEQQAYQPGGFGGWPQPGPLVGPTTEAAPVQPPVSVAATSQAPVSPPVYPSSRVPIPAPRPAEIPVGSVQIGDYLMPQFGAMQAPPNYQAQPDLGDRLGAGFRSWAHTPLGNPFAALANAITGFTTGQFASSPVVKLPDTRLRPPMPSQKQDISIAATPPSFPPVRAQPMVRVFPRRAPLRPR